MARAVRMSAGLPYFYRPVVQHYPTPGGGFPGYIVDGGLLSNFPVWLFDVEGPPPWPTLGFMLVDPRYGRPHRIRGPVSFGGALVSTMLEAHDAPAPGGVGQRRGPFASPPRACGPRILTFPPGSGGGCMRRAWRRPRRFFAEWDFRRYVRLYRVAGPRSRTGNGVREEHATRPSIHLRQR